MHNEKYTKLLEEKLKEIVEMVDNGDIVVSCPYKTYTEESNILEKFYDIIEFVKGLLYESV